MGSMQTLTPPPPPHKKGFIINAYLILFYANTVVESNLVALTFFQIYLSAIQ